jgi:hypothetical protein
VNNLLQFVGSDVDCDLAQDSAVGSDCDKDKVDGLHCSVPNVLRSSMAVAETLYVLLRRK